MVDAQSQNFIFQEYDVMLNRQEVRQDDCWNVGSVYTDWAAWEAAISGMGREGAAVGWPEFLQFQEKGSLSAQEIAELIVLKFNFERQLDKLFVYAHLRHDEDLGDSVALSAFKRAEAICDRYRQETAWIQPLLLTQNDEKLLAVQQDPKMQDYDRYITELIRIKSHTLSEPLEKLLANSAPLLRGYHGAFSAALCADMRLPAVADATGELKELSWGTYPVYMKGEDRELRRNAFNAVYTTLEQHKNLMCELLSGEMQSQWFVAKTRHFDSCLEAALFPNNIPKSLYQNVIDTIKSRNGIMHRYLAFKKRALNLEEMHLYDIGAPIVKRAFSKFSFDEAVNLVIDAVSPLGKEYQSKLKQGLTCDRWVDRFENVGKRSGAYSSGGYDMFPFILLNYHGTLSDLLTLAHEAGHSMHSLYSIEKQPYPKAGYPIFVAEVASTMLEALMYHRLARQATVEERIELLCQQIEDFRATVFRQVLFAEFELFVHQCIEQGIPLTAQRLAEKYSQLTEEYSGAGVVNDGLASHEWMRIPHFYYGYYVYQYATGLCASRVLAQSLLQEEPGAQERILGFLQSGGSLDPLETLKLAGVDMTTQDPLNRALDAVEKMVEELVELYESIPR